MWLVVVCVFGVWWFDEGFVWVVYACLLHEFVGCGCFSVGCGWIACLADCCV